jgi:hypothetical protein
MTVPVLDLLPYGVAATTLAASIWMFVLVKMELRKSRLRSERQRQTVEETLGALRASIDQIRSRIDETPAATGDSPAPRLRPSINLSHRTQVLRMHRRGERPDQISAAIGIPQREVELLLKVHQATRAALS